MNQAHSKMEGLNYSKFEKAAYVNCEGHSNWLSWDVYRYSLSTEVWGRRHIATHPSMFNPQITPKQWYITYKYRIQRRIFKWYSQTKTSNRIISAAAEYQYKSAEHQTSGIDWSRASFVTLQKKIVLSFCDICRATFGK